MLSKNLANATSYILYRERDLNRNEMLYIGAYYVVQFGVIECDFHAVVAANAVAA